MKLSGSFILGSIISVIMLLFLFWVIQIQIKKEFPDITDKVILKRESMNSIKRGRGIFNKENCYNCHKFEKKCPSLLVNITERRERKWLFQFIRNEALLIAIQDAEVIALKEEYNWANGQHNKYHLTDGQINDILNYLDSF